MPGGLLQLQAYGSASTYLHTDPQITFWKQVWRRSTAFALESIEMPFSGGRPDFGLKVTAPISKGADMASRAWLEITLPDLADYATELVTANSAQPLIQRAYTVGPAATGSGSVRIRVAPPADGSAGAGGWVQVKVVPAGSTWDDVAGYLPGSESTHNTLFQLAAGSGAAYTDHSIPYVDLPAAFTGTPVSLMVRTLNASYAAASAPSAARTVLNLKWCNSVGHAVLDSVEWEIGGTRIDRVPNPDFLDVWSELTEKEEKRLGFNAMVGKYDGYDIWDETRSTRGERTYFVPLPFSFCQTPGAALPVIALQFHESRINVNFKEALDLVKSNLPVSQLIHHATGAPIAITSCQLYVDMVYLDTEERRRMSAMEHEQLLTQIQYLGDFTISPGDPGIVKKIPLDGLNHPIKELIFVYQGHTRYQRNAVTGNDWFNYQLPDSDAADAFLNVRLTLNGTERMPPRSGQYFRQIQPYQHHTRVPTKHVLCYNFGLEPESPNPTGACNFSRLEQASLNVTLSPDIDPNGGKVKVWALGYNVLRYAQGLAGLAFTSG